MKDKGKSVEEFVRIEAYLLSEKAGHPAGMQSYFWTQAELIVQARETAVAKAVKAVAVKKKKAPATTKGQSTVKAAPRAKLKPAPKVEAMPKAAAELKSVKKPMLNGANGKGHQLPPSAKMAAPPRKRTPKQ